MSRARHAWLVGAATLAAGCQRHQSMMSPADERARQIATIGWIVMLGFTVVSAVMWGLLAWAARRRPGSFAEHAPVGADEDRRWIVVGGVVIPGVTFLALLALTIVRMHTAAPAKHDGHAHDGHDGPAIRVIGHRWWWEVQYLGEPADQIVPTANELHLPVGRPMLVELQSVDVIHSFWVPGLEGKVDLIPGHTTHIMLHADAPGVYLGQCAEFCGLQHAHMRLTVIAEPPDEFAAWRAAQAAPAVAATSARELAGAAVFAAGPCAACHAIRGTRALGHVGPDLTHLASRHTIAAGSFPLMRSYVAAWSTRAQSLKPGAEMPDLAAMTGDELDALTTYLMSLR